ncbi:(p)ppGpp synthetase [Candidatus Woesearchaeota archaeon]|nr:MAG: (p)ppGpp synthetase [Candidatus Woesearchaeota archaeon]
MDDDLKFIVDVASEYNPRFKKELVIKAYNFAKEAHKGQKRISGEDYFVHPVETAKILLELKADSYTLCAALLHDVIEETSVTKEEVVKMFGDEIAGLVEGLTHIEKIHFKNKEDYTAENLRKILLATSKDIRIILIRLSDRLHNMRTLKYLRPDQQKRIAQETLTIYAPIAYKLGLMKIKGDLEDLSLRFLKPEVYKKITERIKEKREAREKYAERVMEFLKEKLKEENIPAKVTGRAKYFYSIYRKMTKRNVPIDEIYDLIGIRIVTQTIPQCYAALGLVHKIWRPMPGKFKDYISVPKANGYQSLHTTVVTEDGRVLEVQIRTEEMDLIAEEGIAAHWRYTGRERDKRFDQKINWLKQLLYWKSSEDAKEFIETFKFDLFEKEIVVFTPKGDPISLPEESTPVDFAFEIHTNLGKQCSKAKVNGNIVPLNYILKSGDIVEIVTSNKAKPSRQWLTFVKTSKARQRIKQELGIESVRSSKLKEREAQGVLRNIIVESRRPAKLSKCCSPEYGDEIKAFLTKDGKVTIHKADCENIHTLEKKKEIGVRWRVIPKLDSTDIIVVVRDRVGMLSNILTVISKMGIHITSVKSEMRGGRFKLVIGLKTKEKSVVKQILDNLRVLKDVIDAKISDLP